MLVDRYDSGARHVEQPRSADVEDTLTSVATSPPYLGERRTAQRDARF
jgi:hypothetical protein